MRANLLYLLPATLIILGCSEQQRPPPGALDASAPPTLGVVQAGSVGTCIPVEPVKGYRTCLMSEPQERPPISGGGTRPPPLLPPGAGLGTLPSTADHRAYLQGCVEVHSQGKCGWCTAHATNASLEALLCKSPTLTSQRISEPHLWWLGKERGEFKDCKGGWYISSAFKTVGAMTDQGFLLVRGALWPYADDLAQMNAGKPSDAILKQQGQYGASSNKIYYVPSKDVGALKAALAAGYNVAYAVPVFKGTGWDWWDGNHGQIDVPAPEPPGLCKCSSCPNDKHCLSGYHAILIVGYDDAGGGWFHFLNSWGKWWASSGYGQVSYQVIAKYGTGGRYFSALATKAVTNKPPVPVLRYNTSKPASDADYPYHAAKGPAGPVLVGSSIYLSGAGSHDPEQGPLAHAWSVIAPDGGQVPLYQGASSAKSLFFADQVGTYSVTLTVIEAGSGGLSASSTLKLAISDLPTAPDAGAPDAGAPAPDAKVAPPDAAPPQPDLAPLPDALQAPDAPLPDAPPPDQQLPDQQLPDQQLPAPDAPPKPDAPPVVVDSAKCASPQPLNARKASSPLTVSGSTKGAPNQFGMSITCGTGLNYDGQQRYYRVTLEGGVAYTITIKPVGWDAALYLFWDASCNASKINGQCKSYIADKWGGDAAETLTIKPNYTHDFILVADSFDPASAGSYTLSISW